MSKHCLFDTDFHAQILHNEHFLDANAVSANVCYCLNGNPARGAMCVTHGDNTCTDCKTAFELNHNKTKCVGMFADKVESDFDFEFYTHFCVSIQR